MAAQKTPSSPVPTRCESQIQLLFSRAATDRPRDFDDNLLLLDVSLDPPSMVNVVSYPLVALNTLRNSLEFIMVCVSDVTKYSNLITSLQSRRFGRACCHDAVDFGERRGQDLWF